MKTKFRVALAGNPNCGKTCIFNALTGVRQHVGNYPGVTVESKAGRFSLNGMEIELIDLPGVYSLSSSSPEEDVVFQELTHPGIDLILNVVDSTIPRRSLYLTTQLAELHIPMLLAFNMSDEADRKGLKYDLPKLEQYFGSPIVRTIGCQSSGVRALREQLSESLRLDDHGMPMLSYGADIDDAVNAVSVKVDALHVIRYSHIPARFFAIKLLEHDVCAMRIPEFESVHQEVDAQIVHLKSKHAIETDTFMADRRYAMLAGACSDVTSMTGERRREISDKIDVVMTNKYIGLPLFFLIIYLTFWFTFTFAEPFMGWIEDGFGFLSELVQIWWPTGNAPFLRDLVSNGIIRGVGEVLVFLPNIIFLFFAIALLEGTGYMARAAFVMDGMMRRFGLQGRSFVPLVLGFGCTVPAIMATRSIESERDRKTTIVILPLMSCGARLPIYALIIPAFFVKEYQALMMWIIYTIGVVVALLAARLLKSTLFKGEGEVYLMELPPYRLPTLRSLLLHMWDRAKLYVQKAGTIILLACILLFFANTFPKKVDFSQDYDAAIEQLESEKVLTESQLAVLLTAQLIDQETFAEAKESGTFANEALEALEELELNDVQAAIVAVAQERHAGIAGLENARQSELLEYTISGRVGKALEPLFRPIGFDWKLTTASIGGLAAKEVFVSQLGILYAEGEADEESIPLRQHLIANYTPLQGFSIMLFSLLSIPCLATLVIIRRETNSWNMAVGTGAGLFLLAYIATFIVYQLGSLFGIGTSLL